MRVLTLNVNGIRSASRKGFFDWLPAQGADVVCLQETRIQDAQLDDTMRAPDGMHAVYRHAQKPGYSGVAIYSRREPDRVRTELGDERADHEGRYLQLDFGRTSVVSLYLPSGSSSEERQEAKFRFMDFFREWLKEKRASRRHYLVCGDWNIAHTKLDIKNWRGNQKHSGFLPEEREWMGEVFGELGWTDTFRRLDPVAEASGYTWWSNRGQAFANNVGWRIDYQVATPGLGKRARRAWVAREPRFSDHAPLLVDYEHEP